MKQSSKSTSKQKKLSVIGKDVRPGTLIVFEGQDGSGKSTQIRILQQLLEAHGFFVVQTKWNSDPQIRKLTKSLKENDKNIPAPVFDMVHAADLMNRYINDIEESLMAGMIVLCDRYVYTALARGYGRGLHTPWLTDLYEGLFPTPDLTIHMRVAPDVSLSRSSDASSLNHYEAGMDMSHSTNILKSFTTFQNNVDAAYQDLAQKYGFHTFDGSRPVYETMPEIRSLVNNYIEKKYSVTIQ